MQLVSYYHDYHLGDSIWFLHYVRQMMRKYDDLAIDLYAFAHQLPEIRLASEDLGRFRALRHRDKPHDAINAWVNRNKFLNGRGSLFDKAFVEFFKVLAQEIGRESPVTDVVFDCPAIQRKISDPVDLLLINSMPRSAQWPDNDLEWIAKEAIGRGFKTISTATTRLLEVPCTLDRNMSLVDIAGLAVNAGMVIGIHTAPMLMTFNKWSIDKVQRWVVLDNAHTFSHQRVTWVRRKEELEKAVTEAFDAYRR